jgi:hypothetical protein
MQFEWSHEDRYMSNDGRGPLMARILCATEKIVTLERWNAKNKRPKHLTFPLSLKFFTSQRCGWKKVSAQSNGER